MHFVQMALLGGNHVGGVGRDFHMSAGAFLPLFEPPVIEAVAPIMEKWRLHHPDMDSTWLSPGLEASFSAQIIRAALRTGALENVNYSDIPG